MLWISCTVHKRLQYSPSNCFSILLETPRALTSHDFIVRAIFLLVFLFYFFYFFERQPELYYNVEGQLWVGIVLHAPTC